MKPIVLRFQPSTILIVATLFGLSCNKPAMGETERNDGQTSMNPWAPTAFSKPTDAELKRQLTPLQYDVTQHEGTERPFQNSYWDNKDAGIYVDIVSGEPLFASIHKYESGTGWPSFWQPLEPSHIVERDDFRLFSKRIEIRSKYGDSHLGHVFDDGPAPTGLRYCMNSAAMRFIPAADLQKEGYGQYAQLFETTPKSAAKDQTMTNSSQTETAVLAGGCFWGVEELLRELPGIINTEVGYTGGITENPTYNDIKKGNTGHAESVQIVFDPSQISYADLLRAFFKIHDPTTLNRQGNDRGTQYRSAIFYRNDDQKKVAEQIKAEAATYPMWTDPIQTEITAASTFTPAESFHQDYLQKNPNGYTCHFWRD